MGVSLSSIPNQLKINNHNSLDQKISFKQSLTFLVLNILTLGIYASSKRVLQQHRFKELKLDHVELNQALTDLLNKWSILEENCHQQIAKLIELRQQSFDSELQIESAPSSIKDEIEDLKKQQTEIYQIIYPDSHHLPLNFSTIVLSIIHFVGNMIANVMTLGLYGTYQNHINDKKILILRKQNQEIEDEINRKNQHKYNQICGLIELVENKLFLEEENEQIRNTDPGKAYLELQQAQQEIHNLQIDIENLQTDIKGLDQVKSVVDTQLVVTNQNLTQLQVDHAQTQLERDQYLNQIQDLQQKLNQAKNMQGVANQVVQLTGQYRDELAQLIPQLGPIPSKIRSLPLPKIQIVEGASTIKDDLSIDSKDRIQAENYCKRYERLYSAAEVVEIGFKFAFDALLKLAKNGDKIKINDSCQTRSTVGRFAIYNYFILDLLEGAEIYDDLCDGYSLKINDNVYMYPSRPEKVLQYKDNQMGGLQPSIIINYKRQDQFTPPAHTLKLRDGVDGLSAKWIIKHLSSPEKQHLFNLLMGSVIENSHSDYQKTKQFMRNVKDPRVQLVQTAYDLISDIGVAIEKQFGQSILSRAWSNFYENYGEDELDETYTKKAFEKIEDQIDLNQVKDTTVVQSVKSENYVDWVLDLDVIGDKRTGDKNYRQPEFVEIIVNAQEIYKAALKHLPLLIKDATVNQNQVCKRLEWDQVNSQYHVSHQMIGADQSGEGGQHCLFSNLLAILLSNSHDLNDDNTWKMRKAMANYLDKVLAAKFKGTHLKKQLNLTDEEKSLVEMADLAVAFENSIKANYNCSSADYQAWLRGEPTKANIDLNQLTAFEIQLCAYTFGIKIGVLPMNVTDANKNPVNYPVKTNELGLYVPIDVSDYYGPNTLGYLLMGCNNVSYYGLFPKLDLTNLYAITNDAGELNQYTNDLQDLQTYWKKIQMGKTN